MRRRMGWAGFAAARLTTTTRMTIGLVLVTPRRSILNRVPPRFWVVRWCWVGSLLVIPVVVILNRLMIMGIVLRRVRSACAIIPCRVVGIVRRWGRWSSVRRVGLRRCAAVLIRRMTGRRRRSRRDGQRSVPRRWGWGWRWKRCPSSSRCCSPGSLGELLLGKVRNRR